MNTTTGDIEDVLAAGEDLIDTDVNIAHSVSEGIVYVVDGVGSGIKDLYLYLLYKAGDLSADDYLKQAYEQNPLQPAFLRLFGDAVYNEYDSSGYRKINDKAQDIAIANKIRRDKDGKQEYVEDQFLMIFAGMDRDILKRISRLSKSKDGDNVYTLSPFLFRKNFCLTEEYLLKTKTGIHCKYFTDAIQTKFDTYPDQLYANHLNPTKFKEIKSTMQVQMQEDLDKYNSLIELNTNLSDDAYIYKDRYETYKRILAMYEGRY